MSKRKPPVGLRVGGRDVMPDIEDAAERAQTGRRTIADIDLMRAGEEFTLPNGTRVRRVPGGPVMYSLYRKDDPNTGHAFRPDKVKEMAEQYEDEAR